MSTVTLEDAKRRLGELVQSLPAEREIVITLNNQPVARLTSIVGQTNQNPLRFAASSINELEDKLVEGIHQLNEGAGIPSEAAAQDLRERAKARRPA